MNEITNTKKSKLMKWFKTSIIPNKENKEPKGHQPTTMKGPSKPKLQPVTSLRMKLKKLQKPKLKQSKSADEPSKLEANDPAVKLAKISAQQSHNKCFTQMSNDSHPLSLWMDINHNNCDSQQMALQASSKCTSNSECGPCKRIHFIIKHCDLTMTITDDAVSNSINELPGYSHIGLSKDFRHLQIYHIKKTNHKTKNKHRQKESVDYSNTKSLLKHIYASLSKYDINMNMNIKKETTDSPLLDDSNVNVLTAVSKLMMDLKTKKDFNNEYMKLGLLSKGANGKIYAIKSWKKHDFYAMKEICFKNLSANIMYEILRNWRMVQRLELVGKETEIYIDAHKSIFLIVLHLFKGSMCELLKETYIKKRRCLTENELKNVLQNGVMNTLKVMHGNGYIHGDIKPENLVYEFNNKQDNDSINNISTAIIDYDLCTRFNTSCKDNAVLSEWRGTLGYSAPEWSPYRRIESQITPKVDIYSLGLTMLILLCGEQPFLCPTAVKLKLEKDDPSINIKQFVYETMINNGEFMISHFLKELAPKISVDLYDLLSSMLIFDPQHRIDTERVINHKWFN